jgi:hypothetical protein
MNENWQVGDLALCIYDDEWACVETGLDETQVPRAGKTYLVTEIDADLPGFLCLVLAGWPGKAWWAECFSKAAPPAADEFDREVIAEYLRQPDEVAG